MKVSSKFLLIFISASIILIFSFLSRAEHFTGHEQLNITFVNHSGVSSNTLSNNFGVTITNTTKTAVFFTQNAGKTGNSLTLNKCNLANSTIVSCVRNGTQSIELEVYTAEFDSGIIVRRGNLTIGAGTQTATVDLVNTTNLSTSFILFSNTANNSINQEERFLFFANFTNETVIQFSRNGTQDKSDIEWQVIEFTDNSTVQAGTNSIDGTTTRISVNITRVDLTKSFIVIFYNATRTIGNEGRYGVRTSFINETQINLSRNTGSAGDRIDISWFVVSLNHTNASVQQINTTQTGLETNVTITEVNLSRTVAVGSYEIGTNGLNVYKTAVNFTNTTVFQEIVSNINAPGNQRTSTWFIIQFPFTTSAAPAPSDTCTPPSNTNWTINAPDNCVISGQSINVTRIFINGRSGTVIFRNSNITSLDCRIEPNPDAVQDNITVSIEATVSWGNAC